MRDRLIFGLHDKDMQRDVLEERLTDLTLTRTREICRSREGSTQTQDKIYCKEVNQVGKRGRGSNKLSHKQGKRGGDSDNLGTGTGDKGGSSSTGVGIGVKGGDTITDCGSCGLSHLQGACPAKEAKCRRCGEKGHFAAKCPNEVKHYYRVSLDSTKEKWEPLLQLETTIIDKAREITWLVDTGAQVAIMEPQVVELFGTVKLEPSYIWLAMANEMHVKVVGQVSITVHAGERSHKLQVHMVKGFTKPTLNLNSLVTLGLIEEGWPNMRQSSQGKDQISHLTDKGLEGEKGVEEKFREYSVGSLQVVGKAEEKTNKAPRKYKYPSWKDWCSVRMGRAKGKQAGKEQELGCSSQGRRRTT